MIDGATADAAAPEVKPLRQSRSYYLRPEQVKALDEACFDLAPHLRERLTPSKVLERLIDRKLGEYIAEEKAGGAQPARVRRKKPADAGSGR